MAEQVNLNKVRVITSDQFVWIRQEKGAIKTVVGPTKVDLQNEEVAIVWDDATKSFAEKSLGEAVQKCVVVPKGFYAELYNPAKVEAEAHPAPNRASDVVELRIGERINVHGNTSFALWPGQKANVIRGHHLPRNGYVLIRVTDSEVAKKYWASAAFAIQPADAVAKDAEGKDVAASQPKSALSTFFTRAPDDLAMGSRYNVRGDQAKFYMPPSGVTVEAETADDGKPIIVSGKRQYVREALTLYTLEYAILDHQSGSKRTPKGPDVVFPEPTESFRFMSGDDGKPTNRFRALVLNEIQGIHLQFANDGKLELAGGVEYDYKAGEERFFTGKELPIYYPEDGHTIVSYAGKTIHYGAHIGKGEGRYVMKRVGEGRGTIRIEHGPQVLLPDASQEVIALRPLTDLEVRDMFPGVDGNGNLATLEWNRKLCEKAKSEPTTRQGAVAADVMDDAPTEFAMLAATERALLGGGERKMKRAAAPAAVAAFAMEASNMGRRQTSGADTVEQKATFTDPRTVVLDNRLKGVPTIDVRDGYAVCVRNGEGERAVKRGPTVHLLEWDERLQVQEVSTGTPKTTKPLQRIAYLQILQNRVTDEYRVMTSDGVNVTVKISHIVDFEGDEQKWFTITNYVKHLCHHTKSRMKAAVRRVPVQEFYEAPTDFIRDTLLGEKPDDGSQRKGLAFPENGMRVIDVDVLSVEISDAKIREALDTLQREVVTTNIDKAREMLALDGLRSKQEGLRARSREEKETATALAKDVVEKEGAKRAELDAAKQTQAVKQTLEQAQADFRLLLERAVADQTLAVAKGQNDEHIRGVQAETAAFVSRWEKVIPGFTEALTALSSGSTMVEVARALSAQQLFGGQDLAEVFNRAFKGTPLAALWEKVEAHARHLLPGNGAQPRV